MPVILHIFTDLLASVGSEKLGSPLEYGDQLTNDWLWSLTLKQLFVSNPVSNFPGVRFCYTNRHTNKHIFVILESLSRR